jgi:hypothetical protein
MTLHEFLDVHYGADGDSRLREMLDAGADVEARGINRGVQVWLPLPVS